MIEDRLYELFITEEESLVLEAMAKSDIPYSQRAQALLAVDTGSSLEQAAMVSGLRITQVRFWVGRFRNSRLSVFPETLLAEIEKAFDIKKEKKTVKKNKVKKKAKKNKKSAQKVKSASEKKLNKKEKKQKTKKTAKAKKEKVVKKSKKISAKKK